MSDGSIEIQVVSALRLALEGAANDRAALGMVEWLLNQAPATDPKDTAGPDLLLQAIRSLGYSLSMESPSGAAAVLRETPAREENE